MTAIIKRNWGLALFLVVVGVCLGALATVVLPRTYRSEMKFLVNNERTDLTLTPSKDTPASSYSEVSETQVNSEIELLKSRDIMSGAVTDTKFLLPSSRNDPPSGAELDRALLKMQRNLNVAAIRKTNVIDVTYSAGEAEAAAAVLRSIADRYEQAHLSAHSSPGSFRFFSEQLKESRRDVAQARLALRDFHLKNDIYSFPQQQSGMLTRMQETEAQLNLLDDQIREHQSRQTGTDRALSSVPDRVVTQMKAVPNQMAVEHLLGTLADLRNRRIDLALKFKTGDKALVALDDQISATAKALADVQQTPAREETTDLDGLHASLNSESVREHILLGALVNRRAGLLKTYQSYLTRLEKLERSSIALAELEADEKKAEDDSAAYNRRLDEARLADSLDREKFSNVKLIEQPVVSSVPVSPKLGLNLALGTFLGSFLAFLIVAIREMGGGQPIGESPSFAEPIIPARAFHARSSGD